MADRCCLPTLGTECPQALAAVAYARRRHAGQRRTDGSPFILHPLEVASLLHASGAPDHLIAAGALHDVLEKTGVSPPGLLQRFGSEIASLVLAVTDDGRITGYATRKALLREQVAGAGNEALTLFAADKLSKVRELRREITAVEGGASQAPGGARSVRTRRLKHYQRSLALLEERLPESPLVRALDDELAALMHDRARLAPTGADAQA